MLQSLVQTRLRGRTVDCTQSTHVIGGCFNTKITSPQRNPASEAMSRRIENGIVQHAEKSTAARHMIVTACLY
eukprot:10256758-Prorocentrum_lima.AAC.1